VITIRIATQLELARARLDIVAHHYRHTFPIPLSQPLTYAVVYGPRGVGDVGWICGWLVFGRMESTECYEGDLTYGSLEDVAAGHAQYSRWEILNLARVWLDPALQPGGWRHGPYYPPGYTDRKGVWRSTLLSTAIGMALDRVVVDYLAARPPCYLDEPYQLREVSSYCDTRRHRGTIYKVAGFRLVRTNKEGIQTWAKQVRGLTPEEDELVQRRSLQHPRSRAYRARRVQLAEQLAMEDL
jgi:hypothetical protein